MRDVEFIDPQGNLMVPMRCELCGEQIGLISPTWDYLRDENIIARCYACAATEEAERITAATEGEARE